MQNARGHSLIEMLVALAILTVVGLVAGAVILTGNKIYTQETTRQVANSRARLAVEKVVARLRDSAARVAAVNYSIDSGGKPLIRDGLFLWTDSRHQTIYIDRDEAGKPGSGLPDIVGWDDTDADGKTDVLALALMPQDDNNDGTQDFVDILKRRVGSSASDVVKRNGVTDGKPDTKWLLVLKRFGSLAKAQAAANWTDVEVLARDVVPFVTINSGVTRYDTIEVEGLHPDNYDYGPDGDFNVKDIGQADGVVDELELGRADSNDGILNTQKEYDIIGSIKLNVTQAVVFEKNRVDVDRTFSSVTPRAFAIVNDRGLAYPAPLI